jgi:hypothetical protein
MHNISTRLDSLQEAVEMAEEMDFEIASINEYVSVNYNDKEDDLKGFCVLM